MSALKAPAWKKIPYLITAMSLIIACTGAPKTKPTTLKVLAAESFLADIAKNVAGARLDIESLVPMGLDPHGFEPVPQDLAKIEESDVLIVNGGGLEDWLTPLMKSSNSHQLLVTASSGLPERVPRADELNLLATHSASGDPHYWLNPINVIKYAENIRDVLIKVDPSGRDAFTRNTQTYNAKLTSLDNWIKNEVTTIPTENRLLVTNHESLGYFADRYGFRIIGAIIPSVTTGQSPSAKQFADLEETIRTLHPKAVFVETGSNPQLANQLSNEVGIKVVTSIYTHTLTAQNGPAPTYIDMMKANTLAIVEALK